MSEVIMILVQDDSGKQWNINLNYVEVVQFPSTIGTLANNLNVEKIVMQGGEVIPVPVGTWAAAIATLLVSFSMGAGTPRNVAPFLYIEGSP